MTRREVHPRLLSVVAATGAATEDQLTLGNGRLKGVDVQTFAFGDSPVRVRYSLDKIGSTTFILNQGWIRGSGTGGQRLTLTSFHDIPVTDQEALAISVRNDSGATVTVEMLVIVE